MKVGVTDGTLVAVEVAVAEDVGGGLVEVEVEVGVKVGWSVGSGVGVAVAGPRVGVIRITTGVAVLVEVRLFKTRMAIAVWLADCVPVALAMFPV